MTLAKNCLSYWKWSCIALIALKHSILSLQWSFLNWWTPLPICQLFWLECCIIFLWWIFTNSKVIISKIYEKAKAVDFSITYSVAKAPTNLASLFLYSFPQSWPSVSNLAKNSTSLTADQDIEHPWMVTMDTSSSMRNLIDPFPKNLRQWMSHSSMQCPSQPKGSGEFSSLVKEGLTSPALKHHNKRAPGVSSPGHKILSSLMWISW